MPLLCKNTFFNYVKIRKIHSSVYEVVHSSSIKRVTRCVSISFVHKFTPRRRTRCNIVIYGVFGYYLLANDIFKCRFPLRCIDHMLTNVHTYVHIYHHLYPNACVKSSIDSSSFRMFDKDWSNSLLFALIKHTLINVKLLLKSTKSAHRCPPSNKMDQIYEYLNVNV